MQNLQSAFGLTVLLAISWLLSEDRRTVSWRLVASGLALAFVLAAAPLKVPPLPAALPGLDGPLDVLERALQAGTSFVFGYVGGGQPPYSVTDASATFSLAF